MIPQSFFCMFVCLQGCFKVAIAVEFGLGEMNALNLGWHCKSVDSQTTLRCGTYPTCSHQTNALAFKGSESMGHALKIPFGNTSARRRLRNHIHPPLRVRSFLHYYRLSCRFLLFSVYKFGVIYCLCCRLSVWTTRDRTLITR